jgi:hypothetical protein
MNIIITEEQLPSLRTVALYYLVIFHLTSMLRKKKVIRGRSAPAVLVVVPKDTDKHINLQNMIDTTVNQTRGENK